MILTISPSSLDSLQECPTKYNYGNIRRLNLLDEDKGKMLRGSLFHEMLECHYKLLALGDLTLGNIILGVTEFARKKYTDDEYDDIQMIEQCVENYQAYAQYYQNDSWTPLAIETPFSKVLFENDQHKIIIEGKIDLIVKNLSGTQFPVDHKTTEKREPPQILSNQFMGYTYVTDSNVFVKNEIGFQKSLGVSDRFHRHVLNYDPANLAEWRENAIYDCMKAIDYIEKQYWPRRYSACKWCKYKRICETTPDNREFKIESLYSTREPFDIFAD